MKRHELPSLLGLAARAAFAPRLGGLASELIGSCSVENTGGRQTWKTATGDLSGAAGGQYPYLKFTGGDGSQFNVDYWKFE